MFGRIWLSFFAIALALAGLGCGGSADENLVPVTGTVRYDGAPVAGASVVFRSDSTIASGMTDASGRFELQAVGRGKGADPGTYKVMVTKLATVEALMQDVEDTMDNPWSPAQADETQSELPARYADFVNSPLQYTVTAGEANNFAIELEP